MRSLADVRLDVTGLIVLIGENGTGKSSIIEGLELLHKVASQNFMDQLHEMHGGLASLLHHRADRLQLSLWLDAAEGRIEYDVALARAGSSTVVDLERLLLDETDGPIVKVIERTRSASEVLADSGERGTAGAKPGELLLTSYGRKPPHQAMTRVLRALEGIDVHLPFDVAPWWLLAEQKRQNTMRDDNVTRSTATLRRLGQNLANAYHELRNNRSPDHWAETLDMVRLGLGYDVVDVTTPATVDGGRIALEVVYRPSDAVSLFGLSDGTLAYLALVALFRLNTSSSLIAFDEPETHLHPALLLRTLDFWEQTARQRPVVLATHADRLLDGLTRPDESVVLCELDEQHNTRLYRPDPDALDNWLNDYRGLGDIRSAGHQASVMTRPVEP